MSFEAATEEKGTLSRFCQIRQTKSDFLHRASSVRCGTLRNQLLSLDGGCHLALKMAVIPSAFFAPHPTQTTPPHPLPLPLGPADTTPAEAACLGRRVWRALSLLAPGHGLDPALGWWARSVTYPFSLRPVQGPPEATEFSLRRNTSSDRIICQPSREEVKVKLRWARFSSPRHLSHSNTTIPASPPIPTGAIALSPHRPPPDPCLPGPKTQPQNDAGDGSCGR